MKIIIDTSDPRLREVLDYELGQIKGDVTFRVSHLITALEGFSRNFPVMPDTAAYAPGMETSKKAAAKIRPLLKGKRVEVLNAIRSAGLAGLTGSEIAARCQMNLYTAKPRCTELRDAGYIRAAGFERNNAHGNPEVVWLATA